MKVQRIKMGIWKSLGSRRERKRWNELLEEKEDWTSRCSGSKYQVGQFIDQHNECSAIRGYFLKLSLLFYHLYRDTETQMILLSRSFFVSLLYFP